MLNNKKWHFHHGLSVLENPQSAISDTKLLSGFVGDNRLNELNNCGLCISLMGMSD